MTFHSGCHCTASAKLGARLARGRPRPGRRARAPRPRDRGAEPVARPASAANSPRCGRGRRAARSSPPGSSITSCAGPYCTSSGCVLVLAMIVEARRPRARAAAACRRRRRSFPGSRGRRRTPARRWRWRAGSATAWSRRDADRAACPARSRAPRNAAARRSKDCPGRRCRRRAPRISVTSSGVSSTGISSGRQSAACTTAAMYFSPTAWNGCGPIMRRSAGMPMTGRAAHKHAVTRGLKVRALSIIFYGVGPATGPTAAIRPHLAVLAAPSGCTASSGASWAANWPIGRFAGRSRTGICWPRPARPVSKIINT